MKSPILEYDSERCYYLLNELRHALRLARAIGEQAVRLVESNYPLPSDVRSKARHAASYAIRWRDLWLEHAERMEGIRRSSVTQAAGCAPPC